MSYLEFLYIMKKIDYRGWIALDVTPRHRNPIEIFSTSIYITKKLAKLAERLDEFPLQESMEKDSPQLIIRKIYDELIK